MSVPIHTHPKGNPTVIVIAAASENRLQIDATHLPALIGSFLDAKRQEISPKSVVNYGIDFEPVTAWNSAQPCARICWRLSISLAGPE